MPKTKKEPQTTASVPYQLRDEFNNLPENTRKRYGNFSRFAIIAIIEKLERLGMAVQEGVGESEELDPAGASPS